MLTLADTKHIILKYLPRTTPPPPHPHKKQTKNNNNNQISHITLAVGHLCGWPSLLPGKGMYVYIYVLVTLHF